MTLKIAIVGPESSGKSTLANQLVTHYHAIEVTEFARSYLEKTSGNYVEKDLVEVAKGQVNLENEALASHPDMIICDTNLLVIKIWSCYKYDRCDSRILTLLESRSYDLHLLLKPDIPWEPGTLRENPDDRDRLFSMYQEEMETNGALYCVIKGLGTQRLEMALNSIDTLRFS